MTCESTTDSEASLKESWAIRLTIAAVIEEALSEEALSILGGSC